MARAGVVYQGRDRHPGSLKVAGLKGGHDRVLPLLADSEQAAWAKDCLSLFRRARGRSAMPHDPLVVCRSGRSIRNPGGWTTGTLDKALARLCNRLAISFTAYQVRHSVITWLQENPGVSAATTQAAAAHASVATQDIYGKRHGREAYPAFMALAEFVADHRRNQRQGEDHGGAVSAMKGA